MFIVTKSILSFALITCTVFGEKWTERDESKRIEQIKTQERRFFEEQLGMSLPEMLSSSERINLSGLDLENLRDETYFPKKPVHSKKFFLSPSQTPAESHQPNLQNSTFYQPLANVIGTSENWCFLCVSPWSSVSDDMQRVIRNLLEVRRAEYPFEAITADCTKPKNLDELFRQKCRYGYCQTLVLTDHNSGSAFTLRGCAESFGAIDIKLLKKRKENACRKKYCYSGPERSSASKFSRIEQWTGQLVQQGQSHRLSAISSAQQKRISVLLLLLLCHVIILYILDLNIKVMYSKLT